VYSIDIYHLIAPTPLRGIFLERWFQFFLGVMAWAVSKIRRNSKPVRELLTFKNVGV
jgi:hypothetical protein